MLFPEHFEKLLIPELKLLKLSPAFLIKLAFEHLHFFDSPLKFLLFVLLVPFQVRFRLFDSFRDRLLVLLLQIFLDFSRGDHFLFLGHGSMEHVGFFEGQLG